MANPVTRLSEAEAVTIASGQSITPAINLGGRIPVGVFMSAGWTAAGMTFQGSPDGSTYYDIHDANGEINMTVSAGIYVAFDPTKLFGVNFLKVRSGTSGVPVNQGAERILTLMLGKPQVDE